MVPRPSTPLAPRCCSFGASPGIRVIAHDSKSNGRSWASLCAPGRKCGMPNVSPPALLAERTLQSRCPKLGQLAAGRTGDVSEAALLAEAGLGIDCEAPNRVSVLAAADGVAERVLWSRRDVRDLPSGQALYPLVTYRRVEQLAGLLPTTCCSDTVPPRCGYRFDRGNVAAGWGCPPRQVISMSPLKTPPRTLVARDPRPHPKAEPHHGTNTTPGTNTGDRSGPALNLSVTYSCCRR